MTADILNLLLEQLRAILATLIDYGERFSRVGLRLSAIEQTSGNLDALSGSDRETFRSLIR